MTVIDAAPDSPAGTEADAQTGTQTGTQADARRHAVLVEHDLLGGIVDAELDALTRAVTALTGVALTTVEVLGPDGPVLLSAHGTAEDVVPRAAVPLHLAGALVGHLRLHDRPPGAPGAGEPAGLADLADVVVALLQRRREQRLGDEARSDLIAVHETLVELQAFDQAMLDALPVGLIAAGPTGQLIRSNRQSIFWHGDSGIAPDVDSTSLTPQYRMYRPDGSTPMPYDELPLVMAVAENRVVHAELVMRPHGRPARLMSCTASPVRLPDGSSLGAVVAVQDITHQRAMEERLRSAALHDGLTGLPNRSLLADRLAHALRAAVRDESRVAVLYCDLDRFKKVNDDHGHAAGDEVLAETAARLTQALRPGDTVARIGGDEFVLMCPGVTSADDAARIADRVMAAMGVPVATSAGEQHVGISVGVVLSHRGSTPETLLTSADEAMYQVKRARRSDQRRRESARDVGP